MPPEDEYVDDGATNPGEQYEYADNVKGDDEIRERISDKFESLASDIDTTITQVFNLLRKHEERRGVVYAVLNQEQDEDFYNELVKINNQLGKAHAILDSYIRLDHSTPKFENFFNKIYNIMIHIRAHRKSIFYTVNIRKTGNHMYPFFELENLLRELGLLFGRLRGVLSIGGDFIKDQPPRAASAPGMGGMGGGYDPYNRAYMPGMQEYASQYGGINSARKPEQFRDIGDQQDRGT